MITTTFGGDKLHFTNDMDIILDYINKIEGEPKTKILQLLENDLVEIEAEGELITFKYDDQENKLLHYGGFIKDRETKKILLIIAESIFAIASFLEGITGRLKEEYFKMYGGESSEE